MEPYIVRSDGRTFSSGLCWFNSHHSSCCWYHLCSAKNIFLLKYFFEPINNVPAARLGDRCNKLGVLNPDPVSPGAQLQAPAQLDFTVYEIPISCLSSTMSLRSFRPEFALGPHLRQKMCPTFFAKLMIRMGCWLSVCPGREPVRDCQNNYHRLWRSLDSQQRQNLTHHKQSDTAWLSIYAS